MFAQSFENSSKQQQRRQKRLQAMQRMQDAADNLNHDANNVLMEDEEIITFDDLPPSLTRDRPWNSTAADTTNAQQHSSSVSVTSASNFLRETQKQHELEHPPTTSTSNTNSNINISPPSLTQALKDEDDLENNTNYLVGTKLETTAAKQFLWDDQSSTASGYTHRSSTVNLHDIKHSFRNNDLDSIEGYKKISGKGSRWSAIHGALPTWAGGRSDTTSKASDVQSDGSGSSRYRDEEGEHLLNLASERLSPKRQKDQPAPTTNHRNNNIASNSPVIVPYNMSDEEEAEEDNGMEDNDDDDSYTHPEGHRRVFLDQEGNLSYDNNPDTNNTFDNGSNDDIHSRRMMNSYKRALKRPLILLCAVGAIVAIVAGVGSLYTNFLTGLGPGDVDGDINGVEDVAVVGDPYFAWGDSNVEENGSGNSTKEEQDNDNAQEGDDIDEAPHPFDKARFNHLRYTLINADASPPSVFLDTQSPQFAALVWLTRDDARQLDPESVYLVQRYGLAVLWFDTTKKNGYESQSVENSATNGDSVGTHNQWLRHDHWLGSDGVCGWEGISCHAHDTDNGSNGDAQHDGNNDGDVSHVELRRNNLHGLIPDELYTTLPYLRVLDLSDNNLAGTLSNHDGLRNWNGLETLNLTSNNIGGSLASFMNDTGDDTQLSSLKGLFLANNLLVESIPHSIGTSMKNLRHLDLSGNSLRGTIPYEIGELKELSTLDLSWNLLMGPMPHELSGLQTLVTLDVCHNSLGGPLISELGRVKYLTILRLNDNHFSGELPTELGHLVHLDELHLNNNDFRGTLPAEISSLDGLDSLNVANNRFEGEFPPEFTSMAGLQHLDISSNQLRGEIPIFIDGMTNLRSLNMAHNDFSSSIPSELGRLYKLEYLYLEDNEFENSVPVELGELSKLKKLALHNNFLVGEVDERICKLADDLFLTQFSADCGGEIPEIVCGCCICHDHEPIVHLNDEP